MKYKKDKSFYPDVLFFLLFVSIVTLSCTQKKNGFVKGNKRPNILFCLADDASWHTFGAYGCKWVNTPGFDRVASSGILFNKAYTPNAKCAPSRSCILTGRNSWQLEAAANHSPHFPAKFKTYVEVLGEHGYWVGRTGKGWAPGDPGMVNGKPRGLTGIEYNNDSIDTPTDGICHVDYAKNFNEFLKDRPNGKPFCFWYGSREPHRPYEFKSGEKLAGKKVSDVKIIPDFWPDVDTIRADMLDYAFEIEYFDSHLQKMLKKLDEIGELKNTIVIVTADNGMPFPRIKGQVYEYSNHLPLAIMWPEGIKNPGRVVDDYVNFVDFAPTILELAGVSQEESGMHSISGRSLTDEFYSGKSGKVIANRDFVLVGKERHDVGRPNDEGYPVRGIIRGDYLYLHNFKIDRWPAGNPETGYLNCDGSPTKTYLLDTRRKKGIMKYWQMNFGKRQSEEMYNIIKDPFCMNNLANSKDFMGLKAKMKAEMTKKLTEQKDPRILGKGDIFDNYPYAGAVHDFYTRYMSGEKIPTSWVSDTDFDSYLGPDKNKE